MPLNIFRENLNVGKAYLLYQTNFEYNALSDETF